MEMNDINHFNSLPQHVVKVQIFDRYFEAPTLAKCSMVCKAFKDIVSQLAQDRIIQENLLAGRFSKQPLVGSSLFASLFNVTQVDLFTCTNKQQYVVQFQDCTLSGRVTEQALVCLRLMRVETGESFDIKWASMSDARECYSIFEKNGLLSVVYGNANKQIIIHSPMQNDVFNVLASLDDYARSLQIVTYKRQQCVLLTTATDLICISLDAGEQQFSWPLDLTPGIIQHPNHSPTQINNHNFTHHIFSVCENNGELDVWICHYGEGLDTHHLQLMHCKDGKCHKKVILWDTIVLDADLKQRAANVTRVVTKTWCFKLMKSPSPLTDTQIYTMQGIKLGGHPYFILSNRIEQLQPYFRRNEEARKPYQQLHLFAWRKLEEDDEHNDLAKGAMNLHHVATLTFPKMINAFRFYEQGEGLQCIVSYDDNSVEKATFALKKSSGETKAAGWTRQQKWILAALAVIVFLGMYKFLRSQRA
jgi:hypothetical protein